MRRFAVSSRLVALFTLFAIVISLAPTVRAQDELPPTPTPSTLDSQTPPASLTPMPGIGGLQPTSDERMPSLGATTAPVEPTVVPPGGIDPLPPVTPSATVPQVTPVLTPPATPPPAPPAIPAPPAVPPVIPTPAPVAALPSSTQALPSIIIRMQVGPDLIAVGDTATITLTVLNESSVAATALNLTLTLPDGAVAATKDGRLKKNEGWNWPGLSLAAGATLTQIVKTQLNRMPPGEALLLRASATAQSLPLSVQATGGAVVVDRNQTATTGRFNPGKKDKLQANAARVTVELPATMAAHPLTIRHVPLAQVGQERKARKQAKLTKRGLQRGLGAFELTATDDAGKDVHQFTAPLTITVGYTPEQLDALNISPADLTLSYFDETSGVWVPVLGQVDLANRTVQAQTDHFTAWQLSDGSSPSAAFIPSLQGFQTSLFTGAASYSYPIVLPAGAGGLKPDLVLSYSSATTDGPAGMRNTTQSSWLGKGWSLQTGYVARNKLQMGATSVSYFSLVFGGRSYDLMQGDPLVGNADTTNPTHWDWRSTDESFIKVRAFEQGDSYNGRGGYSWGTPLKRHVWQVWTKDGTRYDFAEDAWWGWQGDRMEAYKWLLSKVTDTHGNYIVYRYNRLITNAVNGGLPVNGTIDRDVWPAQVQWGGNERTGAEPRYTLNFESYDRGNDTQFEGADNQYPGPNDAPHETRVLQALTLYSNPAGTWQRIKLWWFGTDYGLWSDRVVCNVFCAPDTGYPKLRLNYVQATAFDTAQTQFYLPPTTFSYNTNEGGGSTPSGGWNRLTQIDNGQGGVVTIGYENIANGWGGTFVNRHRVTSRTLRDTTTGASYTWNYGYGTPNINSIGTRWGGTGTGYNPNSAVLYYNEKAEAWRDPSANRGWLLHKPGTEFRGHDLVYEYAPDGSQTEHWFYQGTVDCETPTATNSAILGDSCFQQLRDREILKGREWLTRVRATTWGTVLHETQHSFAVWFLTYSAAPLSGLWRSFSGETRTETRVYDPGGAVSSHATSYSYDPTTGNQTEAWEWDSGTVVRKTVWYYLTRNDGGGYILDRRWGETVNDGAGNLLKLTHWFYDQTTRAELAPTLGELRMTRAYFNLPAQGCCANQTLYGSDTAYTYDAYGNQQTVATYDTYGTFLNGIYSGPGNGGSARTTTTWYDGTFHAFPNQQVNPLGQLSQADYDYQHGTVIKVRDANAVALGQDIGCTNTNSYSIPADNAVTCAQYDAFGRMVLLVKPGSSTAAPTLRNYYYDNERPFRFLRTQLRATDPGGDYQSESQQFYDGLGRLIQTKQESLGWGQQNIVTDMRYDAFGRVIAQSQPRYVATRANNFWEYVSPVIADFEQGVDSRGRLAGGGVTLGGPWYAWENPTTAAGDDINYFDVTANGDSIDNSADYTLNIPQQNWNAYATLRLRWSSWCDGGCSGARGFQVYIHDADGTRNSDGNGYHNLGNVTQDGTINLDFSGANNRDQIDQILIRVAERHFGGVGRAGAHQRTHLNQIEVRLDASEPSPLWTTTTYDALGRPVWITAPDGTRTEHHYGVTNGLRYDDVIDANRHRVQTRSDALGRRREVVELNGNCASGYWPAYACGGSVTANWSIAATTALWL